MYNSFIELDDKIIVSNDYMQILENNNETKDLLKEKNKIESIQYEQNKKKDMIDKLNTLKFKNKMFYLMTIFPLLYLTFGSDFILGMRIYNNVTFTKNPISLLIILNTITVIGVAYIIVKNVKINKQYKASKEKLEKEIETLELMKKESLDKVKTLEESNQLLLEPEINKIDNKELLKNIRNELETLVPKEEKVKEKTLGTRK